MKTFAIVVGMVTDGERVLMLKRSEGPAPTAGKWEVVSGPFREHQCAESTVAVEIQRATGLQTEIVRAGSVYEVHDDDVSRIVKPFLAHQTCGERPQLGHQHDELLWTTPAAALSLDCVDGVRTDLAALGLLPVGA